MGLNCHEINLATVMTMSSIWKKSARNTCAKNAQIPVLVYGAVQDKEER